MTQKNNQTQEKTEQSRLGDLKSSIVAFAAASVVSLVSIVLAPVFFISPVLQHAILCAPIGFMAGLLYQSKKHVTASVGIAVASVFGVAGLAVGATTGHFRDMKHEIDAIPVAAANAQKYNEVPLASSVSRAFSAQAICDDKDIPLTSFPNGETRKILPGADGKRVAVICQPPRR